MGVYIWLLDPTICYDVQVGKSIQITKTRITYKTVMDLEAYPSTPSGASRFHPDLDDAMKTPRFYKDDCDLDSECPDLYTDEDIMNCAPRGWPAIASRQMFYPNAGIHRKFSNLMQRILVQFEVELDCFEQKLLELDKKDEQNGTLQFLPFDRRELLSPYCGGEHRRQSTAGQQNTPIQQTQPTALDHRVPQTTPDQQTQRTTADQQAEPTPPIQQNGTSGNTGHRKERALLMDKITTLYKEYYHFITMHRDFQSMPRASRHQHRVHYKDITKDHLPGRAANQYLWARDDFVNTDRDTVHQWFESILYDSSRWFQKFLSVILCCFYTRDTLYGPSGEVVGHKVRAQRLEGLQKMVITCTSAVLLLIPVGLLHFHAESGKLLSFVITCASTLVFVVVITHFETDYGRALVGLCAFVAVLASFLANLSGSGAGR
ncbi:hypothetical protein PG987_009628 [Apiospora arundinis]